MAVVIVCVLVISIFPAWDMLEQKRRKLKWGMWVRYAMTIEQENYVLCNEIR